MCTMAVTAHIDHAIRIVGSPAALARASGVTRAAISKARKTGRVGPHLAMGIEQATGGRVTRENLRPDLWGDDATFRSGAPPLVAA